MKKWIFFLVVGLVMLFFSTGVAGRDHEVRCDGELMLPGDVCEYTNRSGDVTSRETYDEVKEGNERAHHTFVTWGRWALLGGGLALSALGIWGIVRHRRRRKAAGPSTADLYFQQQAARSGAPAPHPQAQPPFPPRQQFPHPGYPPPQQPRPAGPPSPPGGTDFGPGSGDDVTQRLR
ncbi:MAG TPA: hypothetical protein VH969_24460 [Actinophytocola sp.]|jgi:hypothetical protein|uniref:hypothetical protein n=1 Tax=Actinophytocola sp. TaxID=1872138 RepID=UPI002F958149